MARRKKSPKSIAPWRSRFPESNLHDDNSSNSSNNSSISKSSRCQMCPALPPDSSSPSLPVEGHEYFIDPDGTLTIKNGVCPRNLALMLFTHVFANQSRYETILGENLVKFLLNLKQIVEKHRFMCPTESPIQWANAQNVLKLYAHGSSLKVLPSTQSMENFGSIHNTNPRKRLHQDDSHKTLSTAQGLPDFCVGEDSNKASESKLRDGQTKDKSDKTVDRTHVPDNFLVEPMPTPSPSPSHSPHHVYKTSQLASRDKKNPDSGLTLTPSGSERDHRDGASDSGSIGGASSRVNSPAPSVSSVASSLSLAEAAKQMANTKRGSKILPIASGDGGTRYLCPVCALELPNDHDLTVHIRSHNSQNVRGQVAAPNSCTICGKTLSSQSSLDRHMLVHSGERPFRCKICDMSFTTNGNMHRHARIHEKNGSSTPKPSGRKSSASSSSNAQPSFTSSSTSSSSKGSRGKKEHNQNQTEAFNSEKTPSASSSGIPPLMAEFGSDKLNLFNSQQDPSAILQYYNDMGLRMGQMMFPFGSHHPAFPYQHMMAESSRLPYFSPILNPFTGEVLAKRARLSSPASSHAMMAAAAAKIVPLTHLAREIAREPSPDLRSQQSIPCRMCPRTFNSQWSLDAHMESHVIVDEEMEGESDCAKCKICKTVAKSEESLLLHTLTHHPNDKDLSEPDLKRKSPSPKPDLNQNVSSSLISRKSVTSPTGSGKGSSIISNNSTKSDSNNGCSQGFQNLNFANFTSRKFPLIAKAFCEEECDGAARALKLPVYPCSQCELEFPVEGARDLHEVSHLPEEYTVCPTCKCHFSSSSQLQLHMLKHVSDLHFLESREIENEETNTMTKAHFLAQFGLVTKDIVVLPSMSEVMPGLEEERISSDSKDLESPCLEDQSTDHKHIKEEIKAIKKEESIKAVRDEENDNIKEEKEQKNKRRTPNIQSYSSSDNSTRIGKASTLSSLKISPSLFGEKPALKVSCSSSPSPSSLSVSESDLGFEDLSQTTSFSNEHCDAVLSSSTALRHHQRTHEAAQFCCQVCSYTSTDKSTLLRHMRTHSGERPYKCAVCDYSFTTKANCERHLRQKHGFERDQMTGKIKCNQYIISSSSSSASTLVDDISIKSELSPSNYPSLISSTRNDGHSKMGYQCVKCKVTFTSRKALISHMSNDHPSVPAQDYNKFTASLQNQVDGTVHKTADETKHLLVTPPPAHSHTKEKTPSITSIATNLFESHQKQLLQNLPANLLALLPKGLFETAPFEGQKDNTCSPIFGVGVENNNDDQPLDFSSTGPNKQDDDSVFASTSRQIGQKNKSLISRDTFDNESVPTEVADGPIDLSMTSVPKLQPQPTLLAEVTAVNLSQTQAISSKQSEKAADGTIFTMNVENKNLPLTLSPFYNASLHSANSEHVATTSLNSSKATSHLSPFNLSSQKPNKFEANQTQPEKHPAFPQFFSMMTSPAGQTMLLQAAPIGLISHNEDQSSTSRSADQSSTSRSAALTLNEKMAAFLPNNMTLHPSVYPAGIPMSVLQGVSKSGKAAEIPKTQEADAPVTTKASHRELRQTKRGQDQGKNIGWAQQQKDVKGKGSSSESDSSCDLASVNKILDATDAQRFQGFLNAANEDDEQDYRSESIESGEDSNTSLENMYSKSLTSGESLENKSRPKATQPTGERDQEGMPSSQQDAKTPETQDTPQEVLDTGDQKKALPTVTVNVALVDPVVFNKDIYAGEKLDLSCKKQSKPEVSDPNNMSEQAIAALIEKVSRENVCSPAKKKRNSYADSPHKFSCPYCSRCFPWLSSLNRHLLTHTGQKPFKCPRCPVTFSTKSNRERHLIRKHNVNMTDAASKAIMDRPYKCHLCAFSVFSTPNNLTRHYRDRHPKMSPPLIAEEAAGSDGETEDISYEDEEEYNSLAEQASLRGISDKDIMLQNYIQDGDDEQINFNSNNNIIKTDTHKKRNAVFSLDSPENGMRVTPIGEKLSGFVNRGDHSSNINGLTNGRHNLALFSTNKYGSSTRPGIDDTVLTDTMKNFLDKSVRQALEDSQRRAMEEGSKFVITPAIERHLRSLSTEANSTSDINASQSAGDGATGEAAQCVICDKEFISNESLITHINQDHELELPYRCHLCDMAFCSRLECLQHLENTHRVQWADICVRNNIGNIQVFATRLDKMIKKISKRQLSGSNLTPKQELSSKNETNQKIQPFKENETEANGKESSDAEKECLHNLEGDKEGEQSSNCHDDSSSDDSSDQSLTERNGDDSTNAGKAQDVVKDDYLQRRFYCSVCPKRYWSMSELRMHMRSHTGERPHECLLCQRKFSLKNSLTRHMYRHHPDQIKEAKTSAEDLPSDKFENLTEISSMECNPDCSDEKKEGTESKSTKAEESIKIENIAENQIENLESTEGDEDMLHDLLGVESSTIDQIFDAQDSAASLLGV